MLDYFNINNSNATSTNDNYIRKVSRIRWVLFSHNYDPRYFSATSIDLTYFMLAIATAMLIHSFLMKGFEYSQVRILCDMSNVGAIISAIAILVASSYGNNNLMFTLFYDFIYTSVGVSLVQAGDLGLFYFRFLAVKKKEAHLWKRVAIIAWIVIVEYLTWLPMFTIVPFFANVDEPNVATLTYWGIEVETWGYFMYNAFFTYEFGKILYEHHTGKAKYSKAVIYVSRKSFLHLASSVLANGLCAWHPQMELRNLIFNIIVCPCNHFLWNSRVEKWKYKVMPAFLDVPTSLSKGNVTAISSANDRSKSYAIDNEKLGV